MSIKHTTPVGGNIFADLNVPDAENLKLRAEFMLALVEWIESQQMTKAAAAKTLKTTQAEINDLLRGRYEKFTLDRLVKLLNAAGLQVSVSINGASDSNDAWIQAQVDMGKFSSRSEKEVIRARLIAAERSGFSKRTPEQILAAAKEELRRNGEL